MSSTSVQGSGKRRRTQNGGGSDAVKVAVRVRPFAPREISCGARLIIAMQGRTTSISDPGNAAKAPKTFTFDFSYWSHDGFDEGEEDGVLRPEAGSGYADQDRVFDDLGRGVVDNAFEGYNSAVFAYGQTGSGKSYSMVGYGPNRGLIPQTCESLFERATAGEDGSVQYQISFSMLEIYNERIRDLLVSVDNKDAGNLKIRQHPKLGFYVERLTKYPVKDYAALEDLMIEGTLNRTTASTKMNETSSRSHMVVTIHFKQITVGKKKTEKTSDIHLVDLAGSERAETTGATGDRLKEGSNINQSLHTLGNVISALADKAMGKASAKGKPLHIPYRDSALTMLLSNALGGNSRTVMLAAISPAAINYEETLSTLRYANRAKQIRNKAVVNESETDRLIRELKEENARLMGVLQQSGANGNTQEMQHQIAQNELELKDLNVDWEERLAAAKQQWLSEHADDAAHGKDGRDRAKEEPYLANINEDPQLSGVIKHFLQPGSTAVGRKAPKKSKGAGGEAPSGGCDHSLLLTGPSIQTQHCVLKRTANAVSILPLPNAQVVVNGKAISGETALEHRDRVIISPNQLFMFVAAGPERHTDNVQPVPFETIQVEMATSQGMSGLFMDRAATSLKSSQVMERLRADLIDLLPMINEANAISVEMNRRINFELLIKSGASHDLNNKEKQAVVKVTDDRTKHVWMWSKSKFINRRFLIGELYQSWLQGEPFPTDAAKDPFWDPMEDYFLGSVYVYLQCLAYQIDIDETMSVTNYQGGEEGTLQVGIYPCDAKGKPIQEELFVNDPKELKGTRMDFLVKIPFARDLKWVAEDPTRGVVCRYNFYTDTRQRATREVFGTVSPEFNYTKQFTVKSCSDNFLAYLESNALVVELWGKQGTAGPKQTLPMSLSSHSLPDYQLDLIEKESEWSQEKQALLQYIDALKQDRQTIAAHASQLEQEIELLQIEKGALETERQMSVTTLSPGNTQPNMFLNAGSGRDMTRYDSILKTTDEKQSQLLKLVRKFVTDDKATAKKLAGMRKPGRSVPRRDMADVTRLIAAQERQLEQIISLCSKNIQYLKNSAAALHPQ